MQMNGVQLHQMKIQLLYFTPVQFLSCAETPPLALRGLSWPGSGGGGDKVSPEDRVGES